MSEIHWQTDAQIGIMGNKIAELEERLAKVRELHKLVGCLTTTHLSQRICNKCLVAWPCQTIEALSEVKE